MKDTLPSVCCLFLSVNFFLSSFLSVSVSICLSVFLSFCGCDCLTLCFSLSHCLTVSLSLCLSVSLSLCLFVSLPLCIMSISLSLSPRQSASVCLFPCFSVCEFNWACLSDFLSSYFIRGCLYHFGDNLNISGSKIIRKFSQSYEGKKLSILTSKIKYNIFFTFI